jgi:hypothetical protein
MTWPFAGPKGLLVDASRRGGRRNAKSERVRQELAFYVAVALFTACRREPEPAPPPAEKSIALRADAATRIASAEPAPVAREASAPPTPSTPPPLFTLPVSAYQATLAVDDNAISVLTPEAAYRYTANGGLKKIPLPPGFGRALTSSSFVFWSEGALFRVPTAGGKASRVAEVPAEPQTIVAAGEDIAWVTRSSEGKFTLRALENGKLKTLLSSTEELSALLAAEHQLFFVARAEDGSTWRLGAVARSGGEARYSSTKSGRTPAMLALSHDVYYYDGNSFEVRRVTPDLKTEAVVSKGRVCSPIAVAAEIYCGSVEGLFALAKTDASAHRVANGAGKLISDIAATATQVVWLRDTGREQLAVESAPVRN